MQYRIIGCTVRTFVGRVVEYTHGDRTLDVGGSEFAVASSTDRCIISYNCVFWVEKL